MWEMIEYSITNGLLKKDHEPYLITYCYSITSTPPMKLNLLAKKSSKRAFQQAFQPTNECGHPKKL